MEAPPQSVPLTYWAISWAFWLCVFAGVGAFCVHELNAHESKATLGAKNGHIKYLMCKRFALPPRPTWQECLARSQREGRDLLAPATPKEASGRWPSDKTAF